MAIKNIEERMKEMQMAAKDEQMLRVFEADYPGSQASINALTKRIRKHRRFVRPKPSSYLRSRPNKS